MKFQHPQHGFHLASEFEAKALLDAGWTEVPAESQGEAAQLPSPPPTADSADSATSEAPKRRGRPPKAE